MPAIVTSIADGVVAALNAASTTGTLSQQFKAERAYVPVHELKDLTRLRVTVVAAGIDSTLLSRAATSQFDYVVDVGVQQKIGSGKLVEVETRDACDPLMQLCQEICTLFHGQKLADYPTARCISAQNRLIYDPSHVHEMQVFTSVITLTFRKIA